MTTHIKFLVLFIFVFVSKSWSIKFPENDFFPVGSDVRYTLISDKTNIIELSQRLILPDDWETYGIWIIWNIKFNKKNEVNLIFWANYDKEVYLSSIKDDFYERMLPDKILLFSPSIAFQKDIIIGKNIFFTFLREYNEFTHPQRKLKLSSVIRARLKINNIEYFLYFIRKRGLALIETKEEIYIEVRFQK